MNLSNPPALVTQDHLVRLVAVLHFAGGGLALFASVFNCGLLVSLNAGPFAIGTPPEALRWIGVGALALSILCSGFLFLSGDFIRQRVRRRASVAASVLMLAAFPLGTIAGVFSLWVLMTPLTKTLYAPSPRVFLSPPMRDRRSTDPLRRS